ncbi:tyrosine-protein kinase domain-containing protein [Nodosilinea sp. P-1105]|uniref:GumC family protein n=1 Tax=Nodosilinea sp. P-1105 TaxID=2546229 RepID=UPI00146F5E86|nr:tyrosine-protein kinase domain-containing protein [Nodosilinea sp. P-1105]NMF82616.1 polysaccharide biosynthesis tyrosine autokinase [Nodosilinea sp. P-1105]
MAFPKTSSPSPLQPSANGNGHHHNGYLPVPASPVVVEADDDFDLGYLAGVLKRRAVTFVGVTLLSLGGLTLWHLTRPSVYSGGFDLLVEPVTAANALEGDLLNLSSQGTRSGLDYTSQIRVLRSPGVLNPILEAIQQRYPDITYNTLLNNLTINRDGESKVLRVNYREQDPEVAAFVLSQLAEGFIDYSVQDRQAELRRGLIFLDEQLDEKWQEVATIEDDLSDFQKQYDLVDVNAASESVTQRLNQMQANQEGLRVELASQISLYNALQDQVGFQPSTAVRVANLSESPTYQRLLSDLREVEQSIASELARFQADTPMVEALDDQRQQLLPLLEAEANRVLAANTEVDHDSLGHQGSVSRELMQQLVDAANQVEVLRTQDQAISQVTQQLQGEIQRLADLSRSYQQIARELAVTEDSLNQLLTSRQDLRFKMAQQTSPWQLVSPLNQASVVPVTNLPRNLLLSTVISLLLGGAAALLRDKFDQVFHDAEELSKVTRLPNLALVPESPGLEQRSLLMNPRLVSTMEEVLVQHQGDSSPYTSFSFTEAFYSLDANLRLLSSDAPIQLVVFTSSVPGEGKSTICAHLAIASANMGRRVLLIDGDMRKPSQHLMFEVPNHLGLSDLITQPQEPLPDFVKPITGNPNLHLLTAGTQPPAPGRLLSSRKMQHITEQYRRHYDLIIFDTPPLAGMIDAKLIAAQADGLLLVSRLHKTARQDVQRVMTDLGNTVQAPLLGVVVNGVVKRRQRDDYADYYGYYGRARGPLAVSGRR